MKALIVDDDSGMLNALRSNLTGMGFDVACASSGQQVLEALEGGIRTNLSVRTGAWR